MNTATVMEHLGKLLSPGAFRVALDLRTRVADLPPREAASALVLALVSLTVTHRLGRDDLIEILAVALEALRGEKKPDETPSDEETEPQ